MVTGAGIVSPLGAGVATNWERIISGKTGTTFIVSLFSRDFSAGSAPYGPQGSSQADVRCPLARRCPVPRRP